MDEKVQCVSKLIKRLHLIALFPVLLVFFILLIYFDPNKKIVLFSFLFLLLPSILYGKFWARNFFCLLKNRKVIKRKLWYVPSFVTLYVISVSYLILSFFTKYTAFMKIVIVIEIWCIFYIFYAIGFYFSHAKIK
jgi:hypothetical protein